MMNLLTTVPASHRNQALLQGLTEKNTSLQGIGVRCSEDACACEFEIWIKLRCLQRVDTAQRAASSSSLVRGSSHCQLAYWRS